MDIKIPGYIIQCKIGIGGMATVYLAHQLNFDQDVALKIMDTALLTDPQFSERFTNEARITRHFRHQNIVLVHDVGEHGNLHYIAMEYLSHGDLAKPLKQVITVRDTIQIMADMCDALDYAHHMGYVHRDIKPGNILFRDDGAAVLTDFGIAKNLNGDSGLTVTGAMIGTPTYMSPEQARGLPVDSRSDLYSLGVVLYQLLSGTVPYSSGTPMSVARKHINAPIPQLPDTLAVYQNFIIKALAKDPDKRFQTGKEFIRSLKAIALPADLSADTIVYSSLAPRSGDPDKSGGSAGATSEPAPANEHNAALEDPTESADDMRTKRYDRDSASKRSINHIARPPIYSYKKPWIWLTCLAIAVGATFIILEKGLFVTQDDLPTRLSSISSISSKIEIILATASTALEEDRLQDAESGFRSVLVFNINNQLAQKGLSKVGSAYLEMARQSFTTGDIDQAQAFLSDALRVDADHPQLAKLQNEIQSFVYRKEREAEKQRELENQVAAELDNANQSIAEGRWVSPDEHNAYSYYRRVLGLDPDNKDAQEGVATVASHFTSLASAAVSQENFGEAKTYLSVALQILPDFIEVEQVQAEMKIAQREAETRKEEQKRIMQEQQEVAKLLADATADLDAGRYDLPSGDNALESFQQILSINNTQQDALNGIAAIANHYWGLFEEGLEKGELDVAEDHLLKVQRYAPERSDFANAHERLQSAKFDQERVLLRAQQIGKLADTATRKFSSGQYEDAYKDYQNILQLQSDNPEARNGVEKIVTLYLDQAESLIDDRQFDTASELIAKIVEMAPNHESIQNIQQRLNSAVRQKTPKQPKKIVGVEPEPEKRRQGVVSKPEQKPVGKQLKITENNAETQKIEQLLSQARQAQDEGRLIHPDGQSARDHYASVIEIDAKHEKALEGLNQIAGQLIGRARLNLNDGNLEDAHNNLVAVAAINPSHPELTTLQQRLTGEKSAREAQALTDSRVVELLTATESYLASAPLTLSNVTRAYAQYQQLAKIAPDEERLPNTLASISSAYLLVAENQYSDGEFEAALATVEEGLAVKNGKSSELEALKVKIMKRLRKSKAKPRVLPRF